MWNITNEVKDKFAKCNLLPIHESDEDWEYALQAAKEEGEDLITSLKEDLAQVKEDLLHVLPNRFIPYVEIETLNQPTLPKEVREDYLQWVNTANKEFAQILDAAFERTKEAVAFLSTDVQDVFAESLHDSMIERIERDGDTLHLYINSDGGFSTKAHVHFTFHHVGAEETEQPLQVGQWLIYYELQKRDEGYAFRVLFDCPDAEWTIYMKEIDAHYYYRPKEYVTLRDERKIEETSFTEYVASLNPEHRYWFITPHFTSPIVSLSKNISLENGTIQFSQNEIVVTVNNQDFTYDLTEYEPISFIYTDVYEDPYAHFSEPVPTDKLEEMALGNDLELQVRAWNTMYANPQELADIINRILSKFFITEENEMMGYVFINHFYKNEILTEDIIEKFKTLLDM